MSMDSTENDAEIARILSEEYQSYSNVKRRKFENNYDTQQKLDKPLSIQKNEYCTQIDDDSEVAFILQIEEIVLLENKINYKTTKFTDAQLEKTHTDMTKALQPDEKTDLMTRIYGMFVTIQTRYTTCQTKNQILIDQIKKLSVQLYPTLILLKTPGKIGARNTTVPTLAIGLITNVLQGKIELNDAKQIMINMQKLWNESNIWYEFLEQLVYILVAITVPSFAQGAMKKVMDKISS